MKKLFMISAMLVGLMGLQACDKAEKPKEEEKAATLGFFDDMKKMGSNVVHQGVDMARSFDKKVDKSVVDAVRKIDKTEVGHTALRGTIAASKKMKDLGASAVRKIDSTEIGHKAITTGTQAIDKLESAAGGFME